MSNFVCTKCKKREAGSFATIAFEYRGLPFTAFKSGLVCKECVRNTKRELFDRLSSELFMPLSGSLPIKVKWDFYEALANEYGSQEAMRDIHSLLLTLGILSYQASGNWAIVSNEEINLNPGDGARTLFFTRREDAEEFARASLSKTHYSWEIRHIGEVLLKSDVMQKVPV